MVECLQFNSYNWVQYMFLSIHFGLLLKLLSVVQTGLWFLIPQHTLMVYISINIVTTNYIRYIYHQFWKRLPCNGFVG